MFRNTKGMPRAGRRRLRPMGERLEDRRLMAADPGYVLSGLQWPNPAHITFSFPPDGVMWDSASNNLNATFNARFGAGAWERQIAMALQSWATVANINVVQVADTALNSDVPGLAQGDPRFGDIRIGGYNFNDPTTLAQTFPPPPGGLTLAGDSEVNTGASWSIGADYDLYSVMLHEMGLALGLAETPDAGPVMSGYYNGVRPGLTAQDVGGIQAIYGPRSPDPFQIQGQATAPGNAVDLTAGLASGQITLRGLSLVTIGDTEYFRVVAPTGATGLRVSANAGGVSLLSPAVRILDPAQTTLAAGGMPQAYGDSVSASLGQVVAGQTYLIAVTGATRDVFAVGAYQLNVAFALAAPSPPPAPPPIPTPIVSTPKPKPVPATIAPDRFEPNNSPGRATQLGVIRQATIGNLSIDSARDVDVFTFRTARAGVYQATAPGLVLQVMDGSGRVLARSTGTVRFGASRAGAKFYVMASAAHGATVAHYSLTIAPQVPTPTPRPRVTPSPSIGHLRAVAAARPIPRG